MEYVLWALVFILGVVLERYRNTVWFTIRRHTKEYKEQERLKANLEEYRRTNKNWYW